MAIQLPKNALQRVQLGQSFAEYDILRKDPQLFVSTPATLVALDPENASCFFIGRRGAGKTAIVYEMERRFRRSINVVPQIFDLLRLPFEIAEFKDTRQRPFKSLMHTMERAILDEIIKKWAQDGVYSFEKGADVVRRERNLIEDCDFDQRVLNLNEEIFEAYSRENDKLWLRQINRSKELLDAVNDNDNAKAGRYVLLIDRLDESWDGSESAVICLMALMHAAVRITAATQHVRPYVFIRENIYDRIRAIDNEFSRLETSVVFLDWSVAKLIELVERRLVRPFTAKPKLGGEAWSYFFEDGSDGSSVDHVMELCQHRPRDVLMLCSYAIDAAMSNGHEKVKATDLEGAGKRYSTSRLKDLGDEFAENYPNISLILEYFYGQGNEFTLVAIEGLIQRLMVNDSVQKYCRDWFYDFTTPYTFIELMFKIGFFGIKKGTNVYYKQTGKDENAKPVIDGTSTFLVHPTYQSALNLRPVLVTDILETTELRNEGLLEEIPKGLKIEEYKEALVIAAEKLQTIPLGTAGASEFEKVVGEIIQLCFFRALTNVQPKVRDIDGVTVKDWMASNRASDGFWDVIRTKYGATQIIWECKNYPDLSADDFHQATYYMNAAVGRFAVIVFRGEIKDSYARHIKHIAQNQNGFVLLLNQRDLEVFLRQA